MAKENTIQNIISGDVSRSSYTFGNITGPDTEETEYKKEEQKVLTKEAEKDPFLKAIETDAFVPIGKEKAGDSFIQSIDSGDINLDDLEFQYSPLIVTGKQMRLFL